MGRTKKKIQGMGVMEIISYIVELTEDEPLSVMGEGRDYIELLASILKLEPMQALLLAIFVDQSDDNQIMPRDIARHFSCRTVNVLAQMEHIDALVKARFIRRRVDSEGRTSYRVPADAINALRQGKLPKAEDLTCGNERAWVNKANDLLRYRSINELSAIDLGERITTLINKNLHMTMVQRIKALELTMDDLILYLAMSNRFIFHDDDCILVSDFEDYFDLEDTFNHASLLGNGQHPLQQKGLVECTSSNGQADTNSWKLTTLSKRDIYAELHLKYTVDMKTTNTNLTCCTDIVPKTLYYNPNVTRQVNQLTTLLEKDRMNRVLKRLGDKGLRKGFTCLFYGGPGTGKTETVLQLARQTGRNVMMVDVPSIRSKWVGETEQNIKDLFDRYRQAVKDSEVTPILVFNEADALLNKRNEGSVNSVDKMENAMQNIILQEMENLEGIMIATTNLTGSLDSAFERRFLYKVEFEKPSPAERRHIWQSLLTDLTDEQSLMLAERYDFSGGQIENIARKRIIADILSDNDALDLDGVIESCDHELLGKRRAARIGFGLCG